MFNIYIALTAIILLVAYFIVIKPLVPLLILKAQLGEKAILIFHPLSGFFEMLTSSEKKHNDVLQSANDALKKNPQAVVILTNFMHKPFLFITGPEHIKDMYNDHHKYAKFDPFMIPNFAQTGLVLSEGQDWKRQRRFLGGAFTFEKLKARLPMINAVINKIAESDPKDNLNQFTSKITGEIVIKSFLGKQAEGLKFEGKEAQVALVELLSDVFLLPVNNPYVLFKQVVFGFKCWDILPIKKEKQLMERINNFKNIVSQLIKERIEELKNKEPEEPQNMVFLDLYVTEYLKEQNSESKTITIQEITDQFITLFFAGTDTTATLSGTCLYYLAQYPEIQQEILEEVRQVVGNGDVKEEHLNKLEKVNALIQESLRIRNPAFAALIRTVKNDQNLLDIKLKKGWFIAQYHNASSQSDKYFQNAENFNIKRWLNNKSVVQNDNGFIHIPFAAGQRNCIGQHMAIIEAKVIIAIMVRKYQIQLNPNVKQIRFGMKFLYCVEPDDCLVYHQRT